MISFPESPKQHLWVRDSCLITDVPSLRIPWPVESTQAARWRQAFSNGTEQWADYSQPQVAKEVINSGSPPLLQLWRRIPQYLLWYISRINFFQLLAVLGVEANSKHWITGPLLILTIHGVQINAQISMNKKYSVWYLIITMNNHEDD